MPPVPMTFRQAAKNDYIDGVFVPKGTLLYVPVCILFVVLCINLISFRRSV